jgi:hypothetical protein
MQLAHGTTIYAQLWRLSFIGAGMQLMTGHVRLSFSEGGRVMTKNGRHSPICRLARSFMISSLPPPIALTLTSR